MKKHLFTFFALVLGLSLGHSLNADMYSDGGVVDGGVVMDEGFGGNGFQGNMGTAEECCPAPHQSGPCICYCPITRYRPQHYCVNRCVQEPYTVQKKCCRYVDQPYTKQHCRYIPQYYTKTYTKTYCKKVPQYYTTTHCRKVPEYYTTCETKYRTRLCPEQKCRYIPYTQWEKRCVDAPSSDCPTCPVDGGYSQPVQQGGCPTCP